MKIFIGWLKCIRNIRKNSIWAGLLSESVLGSFFIDGNLTAQKYNNMLRNEIVSAIQTIVGRNFNDV